MKRLWQTLTFNKITMEEFKEIKGFEDYQVSNLGSVISRKRGYWTSLKPQKDKMGYLHVRLYQRGNTLGTYDNGQPIPKLFKVHTLVLETFSPKPESAETLEVNHKDGNKKNNRLENLEWVTRSENIKHAVDNGLRENAMRNSALLLKKVTKAVLPSGEELLFHSRKHCALYFDVPPSTISTAITNGLTYKRGKLRDIQFSDVKEIPDSKLWVELSKIEEKLLQYQLTLD